MIEILNQSGISLRSFRWGGETIGADFGSNYYAQVVTGPGGYAWQMSSGALADSDEYGLMINGLPWLQYYEEFIKRHTTGPTPFFIVEQRGKFYHARFATSGMEAERIGKKMYGGGVVIVEARIQGVTYNSDGSIDVTPPTVPEMVSFEADSGTAMTLTWTASLDEEEEIDGGGSAFELVSVIDGGGAFD